MSVLQKQKAEHSFQSHFRQVPFSSSSFPHCSLAPIISFATYFTIQRSNKLPGKCFLKYIHHFGNKFIQPNWSNSERLRTSRRVEELTLFHNIYRRPASEPLNNIVSKFIFVFNNFPYLKLIELINKIANTRQTI